MRGDNVALLACREQELLLAQELGLERHGAGGREQRLRALIELGRHAEAAERGRALLERIDADGGGSNGNLPWVLNVLVEALMPLGRLAEAHALVPRSMAAGRRFGTTVAWQGILVLVAAQQHFDPPAACSATWTGWNRAPGPPDAGEQAALGPCRGDGAGAPGRRGRRRAGGGRPGSGRRGAAALAVRKAN